MLIHFHCTRALRHLLRTFLLLAAFCAPGTAYAVNFSGTYNETFNSMGTTGTTPPVEWSVKVGNSGSTNTTWATTINGTGMNSVASKCARSASFSAAAARIRAGLKLNAGRSIRSSASTQEGAVKSGTAGRNGR